MKKAVFLALIFSIVFFESWGQSSLDSYKYIIVPGQFSFLKKADQYQVNSLVTFLFEREGFNVVSGSNSFPSDLGANSCLGLNLDVVNESGMFNTKLKFSLRDCKNNIVHESKIGVSREKDFKKAYHQAIRNAFEEFENMNYAYNSTNSEIKDLSESIIKAEEVKEEPEKEQLDEVQNEVIEQVQIETVKESSTKISEKKQLKEPKKLKEEVQNEKKVSNKVITRINKNPKIKGADIDSPVDILGDYDMGQWGLSSVVENGDTFRVIGGDEKIEIGTVYKTSKKNVFIIKWTAFKQPRLLVVDNDGNLQIDAMAGQETYKKVN